MNFDMVSVGCPLSKFLAAIHTHVGLLPSMSPHVRPQQVFRRKLPWADGTSVRSIPRMYPHVLFQLTLTRYPPSADVADDRKVVTHLFVLTRIVQFQATLVEVVLLADLALELW